MPIEINSFASLSFYLLILYMYQKEIQVVRFSMIVLFSALMIVYLLLYQIKWNDIVNQLSNIQNIEYETWNNLQLESENTITQFDEESSLLLENNQEQNNNESENTSSLFDDIDEQPTDNQIMVLSGTSLRYWRVESAEKLGISYQYALKDQKDIYYVFLDPERYDFDTIVRTLWGTTYTMSTEKELLENKLFWDKVTFINLPEYQKEKVIMLISIKNNLWLLQMNYSTYHSSKWYLKNLFIE